VNLQRITRVQVLMVGAAVIIGIAAIFFFVFMRPMGAQIATSIESAEAKETYAATRPQVERDLQAAREREVQVNEQWEELIDTRMPKVDLSDPIASTVRMWDFAEEEHQVIQDWFNSSGAVVTGYSFPGWGAAMPSSFPNPDMMRFDPQNWNLTVEVKDFQALCEWLLKLPEAPRFMILNSVTIQGPRQPGQPLVAQVPVTLWQLTGLEPTGGGAGAEGEADAAGAAAGGMRGGGMRGGGMRGGGMRGGGRRRGF
jgi:uncharacterized membrane protein YgcG